MSGRILSGLSLIGLLLLLAACGGNGGSSTTGATETTDEHIDVDDPDAADRPQLRVYFLRDGTVQPVLRSLPNTYAVGTAALDALAAGPTRAEQHDLGLSSDVSSDFGDLTVENGVAKPEGVADSSPTALAQIVYTLTQFPTVKAVEIGGKRYTRKDFEDETPIILVESPLPNETRVEPDPRDRHGEHVRGDVPVRRRRAGRQACSRRTSSPRPRAAARAGRSTFTTKPFTATGDGALVVYELSAKDGSRIHEARIPLHFVKRQ